MTSSKLPLPIVPFLRLLKKCFHFHSRSEFTRRKLRPRAQPLYPILKVAKKMHFYHMGKIQLVQKKKFLRSIFQVLANPNLQTYQFRAWKFNFRKWRNLIGLKFDALLLDLHSFSLASHGLTCVYSGTSLSPSRSKTLLDLLQVYPLADYLKGKFRYKFITNWCIW